MRNRTISGALRSVKVVAMGGGTGLSTLLHGLKQHVVLPGETPYDRTLPFISELSAIVTVSDDGGSSGRLGKNSTSHRPATFVTASLPCLRKRPCFRASFNTDSKPEKDWKAIASETCSCPP